MKKMLCFILLMPALLLVKVQIGQDIGGEAFGDQSGSSVSLSSEGSVVAIGAVANDGSNNNSGHVSAYNLSAVLNLSITYTSIQNGNWDQPSTWLNGNIPPNPLPDGDVIELFHTVTLNINYVNNGSIEVRDANGSFVIASSVQLDNTGIIDIIQTTADNPIVAFASILASNGSLINNSGQLIANRSDFGQIRVALNGVFNNLSGGLLDIYDVLSFSGNTFNNENGATVRTNEGFVQFQFFSGDISNHGTFEILSTCVVRNNATFNNESDGVMNVNGSINLNGPLINEGTINIFENARLLIREVSSEVGSLNTANGVVFNNGTIRAFSDLITSENSFNNSGVLFPTESFFDAQPGILPASGTLAAFGTLKCAINSTDASTGYSILDMNGTIILTNTNLLVEFTADYVPAIADEFTFITATNPVIGTFENLQLPTLPSNMRFSIEYQTNAVVLRVIENIAPSAICQDFTVQLDTNGTASITIAQVDNGSSDAEGAITLSIDRDTFSCADVGVNQVTLTVTDENGLTATCIADVTVELDATTVTEFTNCSTTDFVVDNDAGECGAILDFGFSLQTINTTSEITYSNDFVSGLTSGITEWQNFRAQLTSDIVYNSVTLSGSGDPVGLTLTDPSLVAQIAEALNLGSEVSVTDGINTWVVGDCVGGIELSINKAICNCVEGYTLRPNTGDGNWGGINGATCGAQSQTITLSFDVTTTTEILAPDFTSQCDGVVTQTQGLASGELFPIGTTTVTYLLEDSIGNTDTCSFDVTVNYVTLPTITCPADIVVSANPGQSTATVSVPQPVFTANSSDNTSNTASTSSLYFDGVDDRIAFNNSPALATWTLETWVYLDGSGANYETIYSNYYSGGTESAIWIFNNRINTWYPGGNFSSDTPINDNQWYHIAVSYDGATVQTYLNGVPDGSQATTAAQLPGGFVEIGLEASLPIYDLGGALDEFRIWDIAISQTDIQNRMNTTLNGDESGLALYLPFEEGVACANNTAITEVVDNSSNNYNGVLFNFDLTTSTGNCVSNYWNNADSVTVGDDSITPINDYNGTSNASGDYPLGDTEVVWSITDACGFTETCMMTVTVDGTLSTTDATIKNLKIWSDFNTNEVVISGVLSQKTKVLLYDIKGTLLIEQSLDNNTSENRLDVSKLSDGVYMIKLIANNTNMRIQKLIVQ